VVTDKRNPRDGNFIEKLGTYSPLLAKDSEQRFVVNAERAKYWIANGATPTEAVMKHFVKLGLATESAKAIALRAKATVISQAAKKAKDDAAKAEADAKAAEKAAEEAAAKEAAEAEAKAAEEAAAAAEAQPEAPAEEAPAA
jgi:small subunit ribosomal protein S16